MESLLVTISGHKTLYFAGPVDQKGIVVGPNLSADVRIATRDTMTLRLASGVLEVAFSLPRSQPLLLRPGSSKSFQGLTLQVYSSNGELPSVHVRETETNDPIDQWLENAITDSGALDLNQWLYAVANSLRANSGVVLKFDRFGDTIAAHVRCTIAEAEKNLAVIPEDVRAVIIRTGSQMILPPELQNSERADASITISGMRGAVGMAIASGSRVYGIALLNFDRILREFSVQSESRFKRACRQLALLMDRQQLQNSPRQLRNHSQDSQRMMVGDSASLQSLYEQIRKIAPSRLAVLIHGETGTGKELTAREVHAHSDRSSQPFVAISAAAIPKELAESELFGYSRGAFTGAIRDRAGVFEQANGGTLFLDEIGELSPEVQAKLLRVIQEGIVRRVGEERDRTVDVRLICATHRNLSEMTKIGKFREDLLYRIEGVKLTLIPLRERPGDIPALVEFFSEQICREYEVDDPVWERSALQQIQEQKWPGNIRQLRNFVERTVLLSEDTAIDGADVDKILSQCSTQRAGASASPDRIVPLDEARDAFLREHVRSALIQNGWNKKETAKALGIGLRSLFRYIEDLAVKR